jgi:hypothetical protein
VSRMRKLSDLRVESIPTGGFAVFSISTGNQVEGTFFREEWQAGLALDRMRFAPSLQKQLKIRRIKNERGTAYIGRPFWSIEVRIQRVGGECPWQLQVWDEHGARPMVWYTSLTRALEAVQKIGREKTTTRNILNPGAGEIEIERSAKGGCCDPGTETYHSM